MDHKDFQIGKPFWCGGQERICTDVGLRVIVAIERKDGWNDGPPYAVAEAVFDENDMTGCSFSEDEDDPILPRER